MTTQAESLRAAIMRLPTHVTSPRGRVRNQSVWVRREAVIEVLAATPPAEGLDEAANGTGPLTDEEERTLRNHEPDLFLSTDYWGGTMIRRLLATIDKLRHEAEIAARL